MVVSLLALLFVIVTGFLSLARVDRGMVVDLRRAELTDAIVDDTNARVIALIKDQLVNEAGAVLGGGDARSYSDADIPGYRSSRWLAPLEPVLDPAWLPDPDTVGWLGSWLVLEQYRWPAVSSLDGSLSLPQPFRLFHLMCDHDYSQPLFQISDAQWNARVPFMDADGDGVPDAHFLLSGPATEAANTMAGTPVQLPRYDPGGSDPFAAWMIPALDPSNGTLSDEKWQRYDDHARYEVAVRVISHGGMVTLDSPALSMQGQAITPFNRDFTVDLFDATRNQLDAAMVAQYPPTVGDPHPPSSEDRLFDELRDNASAIEPLLRRRFVLPGAPDEGDGTRRVPPILAELYGESGRGFPWTLLPSFGLTAPGGLPNSRWQRVNVGVSGSDINERQYWARAVSLSPRRYNTTPAAANSYDRRHEMTTVNSSDELARKQVAGDPQPTLSTPLDLDATGRRGATYRGELKFYLGEASKAFIEVDALGNPATGTGRYRFDRVRGRVIIEQLARLYYDMLAGHSNAAGTDDWLSLFASNQNGKQAVSRRQQAFMLAVNTVAFAAPRNTNGWLDADEPAGFIDAVRYADDGGTPSNTADDAVYIGYSPQPFFSEVILSLQDEEDPNEVPEEDPNKLNYAVAIELYNPSDPYYDFSAPQQAGGLWPDVYALPAAQFAISVDEVVPDGPAVDSWEILDSGDIGATRINGRSFLTMVVRNDAGMNHDFDGVAVDPVTGSQLETITLQLEDTSPSGPGPQQLNPLVLTLWRKADVYPGDPNMPADRWYPVDRIEVRRPMAPGWRSQYRDTSPTRYFGMVDLNGDGNITGALPPAGEDTDNDGVPDTYARWNLVVGRENRASGSLGGLQTDSLNSGKWFDGANVVDPDNPSIYLSTARAQIYTSQYEEALEKLVLAVAEGRAGKTSTAEFFRNYSRQ